MTQFKNPEQPLKYHPDYDGLGDRICDAIASSPKTLKKICDENKANGFPCDVVVYSWIHKYPDFADKYYKARASQTEVLLQDITESVYDEYRDKWVNRHGEEIPHTVAIQRDKLKMELVKWQAQKLNSRYIDKQQVDLNNNISHEDGLKDLG